MPSEIMPGLFLGSHADSEDIKSLQESNITIILNMAAECCHLPEDNIEGITYENIALDDHCDASISSYFERTNAFIQNAMDEKKQILVHCRSGVSRAPTTVIAYLMLTEKLSFNKALEAVRQERSHVNPNLGFTIQLKAYEESLKLSLKGYEQALALEPSEQTISACEEYLTLPKSTDDSNKSIQDIANSVIIPPAQVNFGQIAAPPQLSSKRRGSKKVTNVKKEESATPSVT